MPNLLCRHCGFINPPGMRYCGNCGKRLEEEDLPRTGRLSQDTPLLNSLPGQVGVMMGADLMERFRQAGLEASGQRRNVSILFADISGFTRLSQQIDTEEVYILIQQFASLLAKDVYKYEGMVDKFMGDGLMAIFGAPIAHENNPELAIRSAIDMQADMATFSQEVHERFNVELRLHVGVHSGEVVVGSIGSSLLMNYTAIGDTVNLAARLQQNADPGTILVSENVFQATRALIDYEPLKPILVKGVTEPVPVWRVIDIRQKPGSVRGIEGLTANMIGRKDELNKLSAAAKNLIDNKKSSFFLIEGEAGIGKSRLTNEFRSIVNNMGVRILTGQSYTYRKAVAYWIFLDILRARLNLQPNSTSELVHQALYTRLREIAPDRMLSILPYLEYLLVPSTNNPQVIERIKYLDAAQLRQRLFIAIRDYLFAEARHHPLALVFEDLHWADETSVEMISFLVDGLGDVPIMLLAISRPVQDPKTLELLDHASHTFQENYYHLRLQSLTPQQSNELLVELLTIPNLPVELRDQIIHRSSGNPFYLEEIIRMLIDEKIIQYDPSGWKPVPGANFDLVGVPDTLQGLILARFDRLNELHRRVLQVATVIGRSFSSTILFGVLSQLDTETIKGTLQHLIDREFIQPIEGQPDADYTFRHVLVSDTIYHTLLRGDRSKLHGQVGATMEALYADHLDEMVEILARHYAWSSNFERALHYLILAGEKAAHSYANQQAKQNFDAAIRLIKRMPSDPDRAYRAHFGLGNVLLLTGEYPQAYEIFESALEDLKSMDPSKNVQARSSLLRRIATTLERQGDYEQAQTHLTEAQKLLEKHPQADPVEYGWILNDLGWIEFRRGYLDEAENTLRKALKKVEKTSHADLIASIYNRLGGIFYQKDQLDQAEKFTRKSLELRQEIGDVAAVARSYNNLGLLNWQLGRWNNALQDFTQSVQLQSSLGDVEGAIEIESNLGLIYLDQGNLPEARHHFDTALASAQKIGHSFHIGLSYLHLGRFFLFIEDYQQALENALKCREIFDEIGANENRMDILVCAGQAHIGMGELTQAQEKLQEALSWLEEATASQVVQPEDRALCLRLQGLLHTARREYDEAEKSLSDSAAIYQEVGNQIEEGRANFLLARLAHQYGEKDAARAALAPALEIFWQLGAALDLEKARDLQSSL